MEDSTFSNDILKSYIKNNDFDKVEQTLDMIIKNSKTVSCDISSSISLLLKSKKEIQILTTKAVAELAKNNNQRTYLSNKDIIHDLLTLLNKTVDNNDIVFATQLCRALGNICFDNNNSRNILEELNAIETFRKLLKIAENSESDEYQQLRTVTCGFLLNFLMDKENLLINTWETGILDEIESIINIEKHRLNIKDDCLMHLLFILGLYSDNVVDCCFKLSLNAILVDLLKRSENLDISEMCLQLLHQQCDHDTLKLALAKCELCETLHELLEKHISLATDSRIRALVQQACEIIVIVLTGDDSMHYLYGKKDFVQCMINWLSNSDIDFLVTGILAIGNFARTEQHCIDMVDNGIMIKLISLLTKYKLQSNDIRLQHALLSALRNIAIPQQNKAKLVESGLVQLAISMLENDHPSVVYKLLGTLRMLVDNQVKVAMELLQNEALIIQLTNWAEKSEHPGVSGESPRLMAWLIKHSCQNKDEKISQNLIQVMRSFIKVKGSVSCISNMLSSSHEVMQNEALLALVILLSILLIKNTNVDDKIAIEQILLDVDIASKLNAFLKVTKNENKQLLDNAIVLINLFMKLEKLKHQLDKTDVKIKLKSLLSEKIFSDKIDIIQSILSKFNF